MALIIMAIGLLCAFVNICYWPWSKASPPEPEPPEPEPPEPDPPSCAQPIGHNYIELRSSSQRYAVCSKCGKFI